MHTDSPGRAGSLTFAALTLALILIAPVAARAGALMDALSPEARSNVDAMIRYAVAYDHCRGNYELDDHETDAFVALLSRAVQELPQYATLDADGRKVLTLNLLNEMQNEAAHAPPPDCSVARIGGKRVSIEDVAVRG